jgi:hypothetical protein
MPTKPDVLYDHRPTNCDFVEQESRQTVNTNTPQAVMNRLAEGLDLNILMSPEKSKRIVRPLPP